MTGVSAASGGSASLNNAGNVVFTPSANFSGAAGFTYRISDGEGGSDTARVSLTVGAAPPPDPDPEPANTPPDARNDSGLSTAYRTPITIAAATLLNNDVDADGDSLNVTGVSAASGGSASLNNAGNVVFTPSSNFSGTAGFTYAISDGEGGSDTARVSVIVQDAPTQPGPSDSFMLWDETASPRVASDPDNGAVTLGLRFTADVDASLNALRIYVGDENMNVNAVDVWSDDGARLAHQSITGLGAGGWQTVDLVATLALEAGESYVVSYHTTNGHYPVSQQFFDAGWDAGPISLGANAGVYAYGSADNFPSQTYRASNYWVDIVADLNVDSGGGGDSGGGDSGGEGDAGNPPTPAQSVIGEAGVVTQSQKGSGQWHGVTFATALDDPSVVMGGLTGNGAQPYTVRVRNITDTGFEYQIDEWDYLDGNHTKESISWLAIESGSHVLSDGRVISAGNDFDRW